MLDYLLQIIPTIADGLKVTVSLFCIVWILSIPGGILMAMLRLSKLPLVDKFVDAFVYLMRGTPLMLQILFVYYALPIITDGAIQMDDATAAVLTFVLNYAAYLCEIFRGGIQSISRGPVSYTHLGRWFAVRCTVCRCASLCGWYCFGLLCCGYNCDVSVRLSFCC